MSTLTLEAPEQSAHTFSIKAISGQIGIDEAKGIVECLVSGIGNKDSVGDIVVSGAFDASLKRRKPRVVWGHDWNQPIGKVLEIYEIPASDPRLPDRMKTAGIGALYARVQFNLNTERGREAFANVAFYGQEQEWSIGYKTITADYDPDKQANLLKEVELYEISPVLHGANQLTSTLSVKDGILGTASGEATIDQERVAELLSRAFNKTVRILSMEDGEVVFQSDPDKYWKAAISQEGEEITVSKPTPVQPQVTFTAIGEPAPASMTVKDDEDDSEEKSEDDNPEQAAEKSDNVTYTSNANTTTFSGSTTSTITLGTGDWQYGNGTMVEPDYGNYVWYSSGVGCAKCAEHESQEKAAKLAEEERTIMDDVVDIYKDLLTVKGAAELRSDFKGFMAKASKFFAEQKEAEHVEAEQDILETGYVIHVKCSVSEALEVNKVMRDIPVYCYKADEGVDIHATSVLEHDELMGKVAHALAELDFIPTISVSVPEEVDSDA